jgi:hypothetical protein
MLNDTSFRNLLLLQKMQAFIDSYPSANFTPSQKDAINKLCAVVWEIGRMVLKEEGAIITKL